MTIEVEDYELDETGEELSAQVQTETLNAQAWMFHFCFFDDIWC